MADDIRKRTNSGSSEEFLVDDAPTVSPTVQCQSDGDSSVHKNRIDDNHKMWVPIRNLNEYITCGICKGYLYEASTITECMHTFCKSCLVRHLLRSLLCPTCHILIHPTDPFVNIKLDRLLQDVVYGLLPNLAEEEVAKQKKFFVENETKPVAPAGQRFGQGVFQQHYGVGSGVESVPMPSFVDITLSCKCSSPLERKLEKRFVRVPGVATVNNISLFIKKKLVLPDDHVVELYGFCSEGCTLLEPTSTLSAVKKMLNKEESFMPLEYEISPRDWAF